jgi:predicted FMN-binding regulatory protein PaiB
VSALLAELEREQRINATLLRQLHELQQQVEEAVVAAAAASAAAAQPLAPGASDPADFNGLLAALQTVRQQHTALHHKMQLQQQQAEEQRLALEAQMHTQERQLAVAAAR